jgi:signal transduction histidine kinase
MRIKTRLWLNAGIILIVMLSIALSLVWYQREELKTAQSLALMTEMRKTVFERTLLRDEYLMQQSERARSQWQAKTEHLKNLLVRARDQFTRASDRALLEDVQEAFDGTVSIFSRLTEIRERTMSRGRDPLTLQEGENRLIGQLRLKVYVLIDGIDKLLESVQKETTVAYDRTHVLLLIFVFVGVIATIGNSAAINHLISKRIAELREGAAIIGAGNLDHRIPIKGNDELTDLAQASNEMAGRLKESHTSVENLHKEITARKQAEVEIRETGDRLHLATKAGNMGIWDWNLLTNELTWDQMMYELYGIPKDQFGGAYKAWTACVHPEDFPRSEKEVQMAIRGEKPFDTEFRVIWPDRSIRTIRASALVQQDVEGRPIRMVGINHDITAHKRDEEEVRRLNEDLEKRVRERTAQLEAVNRELESFSYSVSHDLRAPLRSIDGFSESVLAKYRNILDEPGRNDLHRVRAAAQRMGHLIDDLLQLARLSRAQVQLTEVDLSAEAAAVVASLRQLDGGRTVEVIIQEKLTAKADPALIQVLLQNLLDNAWKFTSKNPASRIEMGKTETTRGEAFFIRDNGVGFDMAYANKLFGAFQRLHGQGEFPGTGIGLATAQRIVHRHGGEIWGEGIVDKGAVFYFTLERMT